MQRRSISEFYLQDEDSNKEGVEVNTYEAEDDEDGVIKDVILGLQAIKEPPSKILSEVENMK